MSYKVLVDGLTTHQTVNKLVQPDGSYVYQNGMGQVRLIDEVIPDEEVAEDWREALDSGEGPLYEALKDKLEKTSGDPEQNLARRLDLPFEGYDEMDEEDILSAMKTLPSSAQTAIKRYESARDEPRQQIVNYDIGFGEGPMDRIEGRVGGGDEVNEPDEDKPVRDLTTREISTEGDAELGEGYTGTGAPVVPHGAKKAEEGEETNLQATASRRRGRRERQPKEKDSGGGASGGSTPPPSPAS